MPGIYPFRTANTTGEAMNGLNEKDKALKALCRALTVAVYRGTRLGVAMGDNLHAVSRRPSFAESLQSITDAMYRILGPVPKSEPGKTELYLDGTQRKRAEIESC